MVEMQNLDIPPILQTSHLCNVKCCINTEHLTFEDNYTNKSKKLCFLIRNVSVMEMESGPALSI